MDDTINLMIFYAQAGSAQVLLIANVLLNALGLEGAIMLSKQSAAPRVDLVTCCVALQTITQMPLQSEGGDAVRVVHMPPPASENKTVPLGQAQGGDSGDTLVILAS